MKTKLLKKLRKKAKKEIGVAYHIDKYYVGRRYLIEDKKLSLCTKGCSLEEAKSLLVILRRSWIKGVVYSMKCERNEKTINKKLRKI